MSERGDYTRTCISSSLGNLWKIATTAMKTTLHNELRDMSIAALKTVREKHTFTFQFGFDITLVCKLQDAVETNFLILRSEKS